MENSGMSNRFGILINHYNYNANKLSKELGGSTSKFYKILNGEVAPNYETIVDTLNHFPNVSVEWFVLGRGDMFKGETECSNIYSLENEKLKRENEELRQALVKMTMERLSLKDG